jgi:hypothetical protein
MFPDAVQRSVAHCGLQFVSIQAYFELGRRERTWSTEAAGTRSSKLSINRQPSLWHTSLSRGGRKFAFAAHSRFYDGAVLGSVRLRGS